MGQEDNAHSIQEQQAAELIKQDKLQEAGQIYKKLIAAGTNSHTSFGNLAAICGMQGKFDEAIDLLKKALQLDPSHPTTHNNLGNAFKEQGDLNAAIASYNKAIKLKPNFPNAHFNLSIALKEKGDFPNAHLNHGIALTEKGDINAAIASYNKALELKPNFPEAHKRLGLALKDQGEFDAAITSFNKAIRLKPDSPELHNNLGNTYREQGNLIDALSSYSKAIKLKPDFPDPHLSTSLVTLLRGDYKNGWEKYEWRIHKDISNRESIKPHALPKCDQWDGSQIAEKSKLLLVSEQGLGDTLQFMRYATGLRHQGISVSLCAPTKLHSLIQASGIDPSPLTPEQANNISDGQWIPLLSVPKHLQVSPQNPITNEPYIKATDELNAKWRNTLQSAHKPIIGINWRGNREDVGKQNRNIPTQAFRKMIKASAGSFLCLQRGAQHSEIEQLALSPETIKTQHEALRIADSDISEDFLEYAAIISNCDLVITTGTTVAHISAGLGIPTWVLLPKIPDWRWGLEGDTTFWYPSMRLFRQRERGNWDEVIERVTTALQDHFKNGAK